VEFTEHAHVEAGCSERVAPADRVDVGAESLELPCKRRGRPDLELRGSLSGDLEAVPVDVVGMLMGDEHRFCSVERLGFRECPRIDHQDLPVLLETNARVPHLR
jgi:hypothetical protein